MSSKYISQKNFSGGLSDGAISGIKGSFADAVGCDIHSTPGVLKVNQALVKNSGTTITDLCNYGVYASDGNTYWFGDSGKIYQRTAAGSWSNVYTDSNGEIKGAAEFNGYLYWATDTSLARKVFPGTNWTSDVAQNWQTITTSSFHPMIVLGLYLYVGNARTIASVDDTGTFTAAGTPNVTLDSLPRNQKAKTLGKFGIDLLVGTYTTDGNNTAWILRWDTVSPSYNEIDEIPEDAVNVFITLERNVFAQCGKFGNIYFYNGKSLQRFKKIPGTYENKQMICNPGSVCVFQGMPLFGVSNSSSNPTNQGVYSLYRYDKNYPIALNQEYALSPGNLTGVTVGGMVAFTSSLLVAWKDTTGSTTYGVDLISWTAKYASAYMKSIAYTARRDRRKNWKNYSIQYKSKPANTNLALAYFSNYSSSSTSLTLTDNTTHQKMWNQTEVEAGAMQFQISFTISSNNAPEVEELYIELDELDTV